MASKPSLLYVTPVVPLTTGNGLAMRAGMVLGLLARWYDIHLLFIPLYYPGEVPIPDEFVDRCVATGVMRPPHLGAVGGHSPQEMPFRATTFDAIHIFRLTTVHLARAYLPDDAPGRSRLYLDLDDVESRTHRRLAELYRANGRLADAAQEEAEAERAGREEDAAFARFDRVYVCSRRDRDEIAARTRAEVCVLPNAVRLPPMEEPRAPDDVFTFLFVGTLGYYPNRDALRFFCGEILPIIRRRALMQVAVDVVGSGPADELDWLSRVPCVRLAREAPDLAPFYRQADAVIVPVRGGGGTRIKVLEGFAHQRPVVTTSIGIEGIDARDEEQVLVADTAEAFAERCLRLMADADLRDRLAARAFALVKTAYSTEAVARTAATFLGRPR